MIYILTNKDTNQVYVGRTSASIEDRLAHLQQYAKNGNSSPIHQAIREYGIDSFNVETVDIDEIDQTESEFEEYIATQLGAYDTGYNVRKKGVSRKTKYGTGTKKISVRVDQSLLSSISSLVEKQSGINRSEMINTLLRIGLQYYDTEN